MSYKVNKTDKDQLEIDGFESIKSVKIRQDMENDIKNKHNGQRKAKEASIDIACDVQTGTSIANVLNNKPSYRQSKTVPSILTTAPYNGKSEFIQSINDKDLANQAAQRASLKDCMKHPYVRKNIFLTNAEKKLFIFLQERMNYLSNRISIALNHDIGPIVILSKVRLADIVQVNAAINKQNYFLNKIAYKHIDFVVLSASPALDLICTIELDDYTHNSPDRQRRDEFVNNVLADCGVKLYRIGVRIDSITSQHTRDIEKAVLEYYAPKCPVCGRPMEPKESTRQRNYGHRFYGCIGWYEHGDSYCGKTIDID